MFGFVMADIKELSREEQERYSAVYCGVCRQMRIRSSQTARLGLSYDLTFLSMLLMSLYEPEEETGDRACLLHPVKPKPWIDNRYIRYAADMNVVLSYYNCLDDWQDDHSLAGRAEAALLKKGYEQVLGRYPQNRIP